MGADLYREELRQKLALLQGSLVNNAAVTIYTVSGKNRVHVTFCHNFYNI